MKKQNLKTIYLVCIWVLLYSFSFGQKLLIKEKVFTPESIYNIIYNVSSCSDFLSTGDNAIFNDEGRVISYGNSIGIVEYKYNSEGMLLEEESNDTTFNYDKRWNSYEYDQHGNITKHKYYLFYSRDSHYYTENNEYVYKDSLMVSSLKFYTELSYNSSEIGGSDDSTLTTYFYDASNRLVKEMEEHTKYFAENIVYEYSYDINGALTQIKATTFPNNEYLWSITYEYDYDGNIISRETSFKETKYKDSFTYLDRKMIEKTFRKSIYDEEILTYKYEYDLYGNVVNVKKYTSDGNELKIKHYTPDGIIFISDNITRNYLYNKK